MTVFCARQFAKHGPTLYRSIRALLLAAAVPINPIAAQFKQSALATVPVMPVTRAEAGAKVYQHDKTAFARATQLELVGAPVAVVGGANGNPEFDLTNATEVALLSDGRLTVLAGTNFYLFGANGAHERNLSRKGNGPGELTFPSGNLRLNNDTVLIADAMNRQFIWFTPDKGFVKGKPRVVEGRMPSTRNLIGVLPNSGIVMASTRTMPEATEIGKIVRSSAKFEAVVPDGNTKLIAEVPNFETTAINVTYRGKAGTYPTIRRFSKQTVAAVWDSSLVTGAADAYQLDLRDSNGAITARISVNTPRVPVTRAMIDTTIGIAMQRIRNTSSAERMTLTLQELEKAERDTPVADSLPPYVLLFVTPNKTLWVLDYPIPGTISWSATAFRKDGAILGRLHVPSAGFPVTFGDDRVVVRSEDEDGVISLTVRRIGVATAKPK